MGKTKGFFIKGLITILFIQSFHLGVFAQDHPPIVVIRLNDAISSTLTNNRTLDLAKLDEKIAESNYKQTSSFFLPQVDFSYSAFLSNNPLNTFGFKLQEKSINAQDFNPTLLNSPGSIHDFTTKLNVQQPLLNLDLFLKRKASGKQREVYRFKTQRTEEYLAWEVKKTFIQLEQAYATVEVLKNAISTSNEVFSFTENRFQQGLLQKSDVLNTQVELRSLETSIEKAKSNIQNVSDYLSLLMGKDLGPQYQIEKEINLENLNSDTARTVFENRADFMAMGKAIEASNLMIQSARMSFYPRLNAFGNYQLNDKQGLGFSANAYFIGFQLSWDIFRGNRIKNSITSQVFERDKLREQLTQQKELSQMEINKSLRDLKDSKLDIEQKKLSVEQATESFKILDNRYKQGLLANIEVLRASSQLTGQKFALTESLTNYKLALAYLQFLTHSTTK